MIQEVVNGVTKCVTVKHRKSRVPPSMKKHRKSIRLSTRLWLRIDDYALKNKLNRSQTIERGMHIFLSKNIYDIIADLMEAEGRVGMLKAQLKIGKEIKELLENGERS